MHPDRMIPQVEDEEVCQIRLLRCPFCGSQADWTNRDGIACTLCGASVPAGRNDNETAHQWNLRYKREQDEN